MASEECDFLDIDLLKEEFDEEDKLLDQLPEKLVDKMVVNVGKLMNEMLSLNDHKLVTRFAINCNSDYDPNQIIPNLVKCSQLGISLDKQFNSVSRAGKLITDYGAYRKKKWIYFLKCLRQNNVIETEKPCFVAYCGLIAGIMASIEDNDSHFRVYAQIFNGVIYLFVNNVAIDSPDKQSFCGLKFLYLMSDRNPRTINGFENHFSVNSVKLGEHSLLTLNQTDAIDECGKPVKISSKKVIETRSNKLCFENKKLLQTWCHCSVSGIETIFFGYRDTRNILRGMDEFKTAHLPSNKCWSDAKCVDFLDRLLHFIKRCVTQQFVVYELWYCKRDEFVCCQRFNPITRLNSLLPQWYVNNEVLSEH